ncbi:hypothetical protein PRIPAC_70014 [Pristionchus pacificus]|uniref:Uncharacterized protein n=1 Tax=Pristionchus pacificus TaxID=54126 RepID=A0A2A6C1L0_PRIPA|nr:hypothetical protein PRIPAC_70014 [Pristionchus pacificus]|eukprot:PDM72016.1 hypothetical protein PRIPAC_38423 [Pristionchus pacificus]
MLFLAFLFILVAPTFASDCCDVNVIIPKAGRLVTVFPPLDHCPSQALFYCSAPGGNQRTVLSINGNKTIAIGLENEHSVAPLVCMNNKWYSTYCDRFVDTIDCM